MRRRILLLVVGMTTLVVLAFAIPVAVLLDSAVQQRAAHATTDQADNVAATLRLGAQTTSTLSAYLTSLSARSGRPTSVVLPNNTVLGPAPASLAVGGAPSDGGGPGGGSSGPGGGAPPTGGGAGPGDYPQSTLHPVSGGQVAGTQVRLADGNYLVRVFVSNSALHAGEGKWWALLIGASAGLLVLGAVAGELLTRRIVRPLTRTAHTAHQLSAGDTSARAPTAGPREIAEVGTALNRLADRIDELIAEERETVADLSHRLRTPLTALRLDAEALRDPTEAERVGAHVTTVERTLTAVIHAARRPQREGRLPSCDATAVVRDRIGFWSALAEDQGRAWSAQLPDSPLPVRASADDFAAAIDALLENVIAHTPEGVPFAVRLWEQQDGVYLEVSDEGPGMPADALIRGRSDRGSTGLGLDIARRSAESGGGSMTIQAGPNGGTVITLQLLRP
ncbi:MAG: HAMP domain-containing histidine kinase [Actinomycetota bacterium]|nr:HAMP domain-containing histidine kinase [Actinomycetota bacterium]